MAYVKQEWRDGDRSTPLSAARLNHQEEGISQAHTLISDVLPPRPGGSVDVAQRVVALEAKVSELSKTSGGA